MGYNPNILNATLSGNTSGALAAISSGTLTLAGGNNITLSQAGNAVTISAGAGGGGVAQAAGTQTATSGTVNFANSNGVTFGMSGSNQITATVKTDYQTSGAYLTTARASNDAIGLNTAGTNITATINSSGFSFNAGGYAGTTSGSQSTVGSDIVMTHNTAGLNLGVPKFLTTAQPVGAYLTTAAQSNQVVNSLNGSTGQISLATASSLSSSSNGSTISFGLASNITTALQSAGAYLTTAALSNHSHGNPTLALTNISGTTASASNGLTLSLSANPAGGADGVNILAAGTQTANTTGTVAFNNSNGITFGMSNSSVITASHNGLTTAMASNRGSDFVQANAVFNGTNASGTIASNAISISVAAPGGGGGAALKGSGTYTQNTGTVEFANSNGITFGLSNNGTMTASHNGITSQSVQTQNLMTVNGTQGNVSISGGNGVTVGNNASTVTISVATNYQSQGAYLTTAAQSDQVVNSINGSTGTFSFNTGSSLSSSRVGNAITWGLASNITTALQSAGAYLTTARASNDAAGLNTAITNGTWTVNSSGISLNLSNHLTTAAQSNQVVNSINGSTGAISLATGSSLSSSSNGSTITFGLASNITTALQSAGAYLTTAMASNRGSDFVQANAAFAGTNASGTIASNGISVSVAAPGGGAAVTASASNGSFTAGLLGFSNANNVTFGTSAGSIITASVAAPGAAAENNWVNLLGANTAGNTTASGSTIGYSGINLTLSGTNGSAINISAPATSSLSATGGLGISTNGSTISIGMPFDDFYEPYPLMNAISTTYAPGIGSWNFLYMPVHLPIDSGRINMLYSMGSTSAMLAASNGNSFASNTTGGASWSFLLNRSVAIYKRGAGANSTQLESIWSNTVSNGVSQSMGVSVTNASQLTVQRRVSFQYVQSVETNGLYTTAGLGATHNASFASSNTVSSAATSAISSIYNMMSGAMLVPFGFNTTLSAGDYWLGVAWSTASTTAGTSVNGASIWPHINQGALYGMSSMSHRPFGATVSNTSSQFMPGHGAVYSAASAVPPPTIPFRYLRSAGSHVIPYFNIIQSVAS